MPKKKSFHEYEPDVITYTPENRTDDKLLTVQNIFAAAAAAVFLAGQFVPALKPHHSAVNGLAYLLGAAAYTMELLVLTDRFRRRNHFKELFMPLVFGVLYVILGISYFAAHFA